MESLLNYKGTRTGFAPVVTTSLLCVASFEISSWIKKSIFLGSFIYIFSEYTGRTYSQNYADF